MGIFLCYFENLPEKQPLIEKYSHPSKYTLHSCYKLDFPWRSRNTLLLPLRRNFGTNRNSSFCMIRQKQTHILNSWNFHILYPGDSDIDTFLVLLVKIPNPFGPVQQSYIAIRHRSEARNDSNQSAAIARTNYRILVSRSHNLCDISYHKNKLWLSDENYWSSVEYEWSLPS